MSYLIPTVIEKSQFGPTSLNLLQYSNYRNLQIDFALRGEQIK